MFWKLTKIAKLIKNVVKGKDEKFISTEAIKRIKDSEDNKDAKLKRAYRDMLRVAVFALLLTGCTSPCGVINQAEVCGTLYEGAFCMQNGQEYEYAGHEWQSKQVGRVSIRVEDWQQIKGKCKTNAVIMDTILE